MSKKHKRSSRKHKSFRPPASGRRRQAQYRSARNPSFTSLLRSWWWVGALVLALVIGVVLWFTVGPGKPAGKSSLAPADPADRTVLSTPIPTLPGKSSLAPADPADREGMYSEPPAMQIDTSKTYVATISTAKGDIVAQLDASAAPQTVNNFVFLARQGFYDGLTFHRVEPGFVIQGGDPTGTGGGGPGYTIPAEIKLPHVEGAIAMARQGDEANPTRASSGSQFYITLAPTSFLDGAYTVFGQVTAGMDVVKSIAVGDVIQTIAITEGP